MKMIREYVVKMKTCFLLVLLLNVWAVAQGPLAGNGAPAVKTALDRYVETPDPAYKYEVVNKLPGNGYTAYVVDMTSQAWRSASEVDRTLWKHWLIIIKPDVVKHKKALLAIGGGNNNAAAPQTVGELLTRQALATGSVVAELRMVPNQPLTFLDDNRPRSEDEIIAFTWDKFLREGDERWPLRLPMTKAAVRAMDTVVSLLEKESVKIDGFVVTGGSKRGQAAWTSAAVDKRVVAVIPMVIDSLNVIPSFRHHREVYGYYAPAVRDYEAMGIMAWENSPIYSALMKIEDPYEYRTRLGMPKYIVNATGDQFFLPDSWQFYYKDLPGEKHLRYVPNADHSLAGTDVGLSLLAFYNAVLTNSALPEYSWDIEKDGTVRVRTREKPAEVKLWQATNPTTRDFRLSSIGARWTATPLTPQTSGEYVAKVPPPKRGFTAYMVELTYPSGVPLAPFKFTTGVKVVPDVKPGK